MDLLERDDALSALRAAHASAARGRGRVAVVTGEPGIGKTSLVSRFLEDLGPEEDVLLGRCDHLSIPRPLGPFADLLGSVGAPLEEAIVAGARPQQLHPLLLAEIDRRPRPTVIVFEDVHWADGATLDAIAFLARRVGGLPVLLVLTLRAGEAALDSPLHAALASIPATDTFYLELQPLSRRAVETLAGEAGARVYAATGGNPFYVAELLAFGDSVDVPPSVANAVIGRASQLGESARMLLELVSVVPGRIRVDVLERILPDWTHAAAEAERRNLVEVGARYLSFRHELARIAVLAGMPVATRRALHRDILRALLEIGGDPADIVHHAEAAGDEETIAAHTLVAARRAASVDANREAYAHFHRALDFLPALPRQEQATVLEELTESAFLVARVADAIAATEQAIPIWRELGDQEGVGRCTRVLSRLSWFAGDGAAAQAKASEAVAILEPLGDSAELACAYSGQAQLAMLSDEIDAARAWGARALELAERLEARDTLVHAKVSLASVDVKMDPRATAPVLDAFALADELGCWSEGSRALANLAFSLAMWGCGREARRFAAQAIEYAEQHEVHNIGAYARVTDAWLLVREGAWDEAERAARAGMRGGVSVTQILALTVLAELAVRRGDPDAGDLVADLLARADETGDPQRVVPAVGLAAEAALLAGDELPVERIEALAAAIPAPTSSAIRLDAYAALAGLATGGAAPPSVPYAAMSRGDWAAAADAFGEAGWEYDRALMLSRLDDEDALTEAVAIARDLGAEPLVRHVAAHMRERGLR
ncbi:MAG TPA: AAA family ATPase, partial [Gaiellaceae bacterium]|nr:AAA family ATPase [Gaiellaceae bacterium]